MRRATQSALFTAKNLMFTPFRAFHSVARMLNYSEIIFGGFSAIFGLPTGYQYIVHSLQGAFCEISGRDTWPLFNGRYVLGSNLHNQRPFYEGADYVIYFFPFYKKWMIGTPLGNSQFYAHTLETTSFTPNTTAVTWEIWDGVATLYDPDFVIECSGFEKKIAHTSLMYKKKR